MELTVKVRKSELMDRVESNRAEHRKIFLEALDGYRAAMIEELEKRIARVKAGKRVDQYLRLPEPSDHSSDYDQVLEMLGMHTEDELMISSEDFAHYVRDDWAWKGQFLETASNYTASAQQ